MTHSDFGAVSPQLSEQGIELYKRMMEDATFIKRQQWATTNYAVLIYAAIVWLRQHLSEFPLLKCGLLACAVLTGAVATAILIKFQCELRKLRLRIQGANDYAFKGQERKAFDLRCKEAPFTRGSHILAALIAVAVIGAILTSVAILLMKDGG